MLGTVECTCTCTWNLMHYGRLAHTEVIYLNTYMYQTFTMITIIIIICTCTCTCTCSSVCCTRRYIGFVRLWVSSVVPDLVWPSSQRAPCKSTPSGQGAASTVHQVRWVFLGGGYTIRKCVYQFKDIKVLVILYTTKNIFRRCRFVS